MTTFSDFAAARLDEAGQGTTVDLGRAILAEHGPDDGLTEYGSPGPFRCQRCITDRGRWKEDWDGDLYPCQTLRLVFAAWASHPDYDPAWEPFGHLDSRQ